MKKLVIKKPVTETFTATEARDDKIYACFDKDGELCIATRDSYQKNDSYKFVILSDVTVANSYCGMDFIGPPSLVDLLEMYRSSKSLGTIYEFDSVQELLEWALEQYNELSSDN